MNIMGKEVAKIWSFESSSGSKTYQAVQYEDGSTSCDCMGWTRRNPPGGRNCKHTRAIDLGIADRQSTSSRDYGSPAAATQTRTTTSKSRGKVNVKKLEEDLGGASGVARKIRWKE